MTDKAWASYLRARDGLDEANFWVPSGRNFMGRATPDEPFLFKTKAPINRLVGGGFFVGFWELRVSEAWTTFGEGNGVDSELALRAAIQRYRDRNGSPREPDPTIGCIILRSIFFGTPGDELAPPPHWGSNIVQGKTYGTDDPDYSYVDHVFRAYQGGARFDPAWDQDLVAIDLDEEWYGAPVLTRHRLGQGAFRLAVLDAYDTRCAITGTRTNAPGGTHPALRTRWEASGVEWIGAALGSAHALRPRLYRRRPSPQAARQPTPLRSLRQRRGALRARGAVRDDPAAGRCAQPTRPVSPGVAHGRGLPQRLNRQQAACIRRQRTG